MVVVMKMMMMLAHGWRPTHRVEWAKRDNSP